MKKITAGITVFLIFSTFVISVYGADWDNNAIVWLEPNETDISVGDDFNLTVYINSLGVECSQFNLLTIHYNESVNGTVNATGFQFINVWDGDFDDATYDNVLRKWTNVGSFISSGYPTTNVSGVILNHTALKVGVAYFNVSSMPDVREPDNDKFTVDWNNLTINIHPEQAMMIDAITQNDTVIKLVWKPDNSGYGGWDKVVIRYDSGTYPANPQSGLEAYNGTGSDYGGGRRYYDADVFSPDVHYYFRFWGYNTTYNLFSLQGMSEDATTHGPPGIIVADAYWNMTYGFVVHSEVDEADTDQKIEYSLNETLEESVSVTWDNTTGGPDVNGHYNNSLSAGGLISNTTYYWRFTCYNGSSPEYYANTSIKTATTTNAEPVINNELPNHMSTGVNVSQPSNPAHPGEIFVGITDNEGNKINWSIEVSNGAGSNSSTYDTPNWSYYCDVNLEYETNYTWWVNVTDCYSGGTASDVFWFVTEDAPLNISNPFPGNLTVEVTRNPANLSAKVTGSGLDVSLYFINMTPVSNTWTKVYNWSSGSTGRFEFPGLSSFGRHTEFIWGNTSYMWSVNASMGAVWLNRTFSYTTKELAGTANARYDVDNDDNVFVGDLNTVWANRNGQVTYDGLYDVDNDNNVFVGDLNTIWANR